MDIIVLDPGSCTFRAGYAYTFSSEEEPRVLTPNAVQNTSVSASSGPGAAAEPAVIQPVVRGEICQLDALESLIHYSLYELLQWEAGREGSVVIAEPLLTTRKHRELLAQLMFEVFNVEALYTQDAASLALCSIGKLSGCVADIGHGKIDVATVTDGQANMSTATRIEFGGQDLNMILQRTLARTGIQVNNTQDLQTLKELCSKAAASNSEYQQRWQQIEAISYSLPDGQQITVTSEGEQLAEALLDPTTLQNLPFLDLEQQPEWQAYVSGPSLPTVVGDCLAMSSGIDVANKKAAHAKDLFVCGGGSLIPGLTKRLLSEIRAVSPAEPVPQLCHIPEYLPAHHTTAHAAWLGGVVIARAMNASQFWFTKHEYQESGPMAISRKCAG